MRRPLHGTHFGANAHGGEVIHHRLNDPSIDVVDRTLSGVEAVGMPSLFEQLLGLLGIIGIGFERQSIAELARDNTS